MNKTLCLVFLTLTMGVYGQIPATSTFLIGNNIQVRQYTFDQLRPLLHPTNDTTYIINFWATWCMPCVQELPQFEKLHDSMLYKPVKVVLVSLDMYKNAAQTLTSFILKKQLRSTVLFLHPEGNAWIDEVDKSWDGSLPVTLICNKKSTIFINNTITYSELIENLNKIYKK